MAVVSPGVMVGSTESSGLDLQGLTDKAKQISERRSMLKAQVDAISKQISDIKSSLVHDFGEDYMERFNEAVDLIYKWDQEHA